MRTDRPYRSAMSVEAATEQMRDNAGSQFDAAVVEAMLPVVAAAGAASPAVAPAGSSAAGTTIAPEPATVTVPEPPAVPAAVVAA
jgi:HD-GYP domain-containing protein (c-di-GMP phosphodiesterase class II)